MALENPSTSHPPTTKPAFQTSPFRCTQCNGRPNENGRNLVVCIDGSSNQYNTNVAKLFAKIDMKSAHPEQHSYYARGIGARPNSFNIFGRLERVVSDKFDMAVAWNIEDVVKDAYGWLARTYQEGDQIYLFGFSRGAYQVRVLAGMIHEVGLTRKPREKQNEMAYDRYEAIRSGRPKSRQTAREFKNTFSWKDLRVHFVGVWDTVSSVGLIRGDVFLSTSSAAAHACHFRHALALDERRVKFLPEYFHEMNSQTDDGKSKYIVAPPNVEHTTPASERRAPECDNGIDLPEGRKTTDVKEVWFAGSHSDVGGKDRPGKSHQAGNVSLLWMRREATANGLVLEPTNIVWVPDDLDFGIRNSMSPTWRVIEYLPIKHQVCFSGAGEDARRLHRLQPRRIIPGQKVHSSVLYANVYKPQATLGEGFDVPIIYSTLEDTELDNQIWETGLFDESAAQHLVTSLGSQQGVVSVYLDRLLFMLRFKEGKQYVRNVPNWQNQFMAVIHNRNCAPLDRFIATVAYYEASCDDDVHCALPHSEPSPDVFEDAKNCLRDILAAHEHRDGPRVLTLLRPLTKHHSLRERFLTHEVLETLMKLFDAVIRQPRGKFGQAMDGLNCLLQCEYTQETLVGQLGANPPNSNVSRLSRILKIDDPHLLIAALRMVLTLARIPDARARAVCSVVKPRIRELASDDERLVGLLAVEISLVLYGPNDQGQLDIRDAHIRANLGIALARSNPERHHPAYVHGRSVDPGEQILRHLFGLDATELSDLPRKLIRELKHAVQTGDRRERAEATMTLLKLCETETIRTYLRETDMLNVFVSQLLRKDCALLAAYALVICLRYSDMKESIKDNDDLPRHIVGMLTLDYFDDAVGHVEGFQIFGDLMQHTELRTKIMDYNITDVLNSKLGMGKPKEIRTGLITLGIFRSFVPDGPWTHELVARGLEYLQNPVWRVQRAGVVILSALARTEHGVAAISPRIHEVVEMLLPEGYLPIPASSTSPNECQTQPAATTTEASSDVRLGVPLDAPRPFSRMLGPACALRILAQSKILRDRTRGTMQYTNLKHLYFSGTLVDETDTSPWLVRTPNRADVSSMLGKMIKAVDEELSEDGLMMIGDAVLPHIQHWNRLVTLPRIQAGEVITTLPALLGVSVSATLSVVMHKSVSMSTRVYEFFKRQLSRNRHERISGTLRRPGSHEGENPSAFPDIEHARLPTTKSSVQPSPYRCTQCNGRTNKDGRNLVVCIDGTSNQYNNTNVAKLFAKIDMKATHPKQHSYYSSGIGTRPTFFNISNRLESVVSDKFGMVAWNIEDVVKDAYGWLARMYQEGDQIYLFGFSRGAYQVRVLAGMIHEVGLTRTPREKQIGTAYDCYEAIRSGEPATRETAREFKNMFSWKNLKVHFVGVWDTVSSAGLTREDVFLSTSPAAALACHFRHALALDERRVKFMPEYFYEVNSQTDDGESKYIVTPDVEHAATPASKRHESPVSDKSIDLPVGKKTTDIKEVWFAGSHSDVGGEDRPGKLHQAGNVSLLWMRREATANGLVLEPTDVVWVPDDLDFGISNSMTTPCRAIEYLPIRHQVCFSGAGEDARRRHRAQPRRIIPGQKVHASVLYANVYKPQGTLEDGFDISIMYSPLEDTELDTQIWETGLFDESAAQHLVTSLGNQQENVSVHLDRLLFMLRFKEGKQYVRNVPDWQNQFMAAIHNRHCAPLDRVVTIVGYYEASCVDEVHLKSCAPPDIELSPDVFDGAKDCLRDILAAHEHRGGPRVLTLLRPLTKHHFLRERFLTQEVLETLMKLFDAVIRQPRGKFGQAMDGLNCLLQCEYTRQTLVGQLGANPPNSNVSRLSRILKVDDPHLLNAALRVVLTLARIPDARARAVCSVAKPRIRELASRDKRLVGLLAVEILLAIYDPNDQGQLDIRDAHVRANLSIALAHLNPERHDSVDGPGRSVDPGEQILRHLFGLDATELSEPQRKLIRELKQAVQKGNPRERAEATMTLLKLCETETIRTHLREIDLLDVFISQLLRKDCALLAAYALVICLRYSDMKESIKDNDDLPRHIVGMLTLDYFDDAVGQVEGFQIFGDLMQHAELRTKIMDYNITDVLNSKLGMGKPKEIRTGLITLNIFRSSSQDGSWTHELVARGLEYLQNPVWKVQKSGVMILFALAQTEHGVAAISSRIHEIVEMLLPEGYLPIQPSVRQASPTSPSEGLSSQAPVVRSLTSPNPSLEPPSWMLGPACVLRILAQNKILRNRTRETMQYAMLKHLYISGTLVVEVDTSVWRVRTPNLADVFSMLDTMIKAIDEELSEDGLMLIGSPVLPHIQHWDRLLLLFGNLGSMATTVPLMLLGVSASAVLSAMIITPIYMSARVYGFFKLLLSRYLQARTLVNLRHPGSHEGEITPGETDLGSREDESAGGGGGESSQGVEIMLAQGAGDTQSTTRATNG